ncbi:DNA sulfur modification protein DndE [Nocardiopsis synnemataformans]|uniref:DNA sulfur modification protein DndE n=1 Tax=Nocardiopsis synnemataformans TaxID=61305 RepID=UPI003EB726F4
MSLETIRLSQAARDQLVRLKRTTGIPTWNVLCRWALAISLQDPSVPLVRDIITDSNVEMTWRTFAGTYADVYRALLVHRCVLDGEEPTDAAVARALTIHVHRGIGYLAAGSGSKGIHRLLTQQ